MNSIPEAIKQHLIYNREQLSLSCSRITFERSPRVIRYESDLAHPLGNQVVSYIGASPESSLNEIGQIIAQYKERNRLLSWLTWSHDAGNQDLERALEEKGLKRAASFTGMALNLADWTYSDPTIPDFAIKWVQAKSDFTSFREIVLPPFGLHGEIGEVITHFNESSGFGEQPICRHYFAFLDGRPVGAASAFYNGETIGIYNVATLEAYRGLGIGSALTAYAIREAKAAGAALAVLQSSEIGLGIYRKLGFQDEVEIGYYLG
ncbi:GNAT family N-acetyltransferase [Paenibacillus sp. 5J-6]|uniref:GNAT family N-acetyltransferase n=1 Tax=Paenibacillus silvestris TaxID=2606219 RepID=A0A6L8V8L1_9BACL|nr:GNAT family N-acetyltransferase [Paenibacillus silvestris]MZQ85590.1 GNAT family N-acetyltransferase [Paenibacillus silvestris]